MFLKWVTFIISTEEINDIIKIFYESEKCEILSNRVTEVLQIKKKNKKSILSILLGTPGASLLNFTSFLAAKVIIRPREIIIRANKNL